jgi:hypothetical protein
MKKITICIACAIFVLSACKKTVENLPPATQTGAHTFGARVNGNMWVPQGFGPFPANDILEAIFVDNGELTIRARNFSSSPTETEFEIFVKGVTGPGVYQLNRNAAYTSPAESYGYYVKRKLTPLNEWITGPSYTGTVTITRLDTVNRVVSGTFEFNAINLYNASEPLTVTDGRFDIRLL